MKTVYIDTGPLVALLDRRDQFNHWVQGQMAEIEGGFVTCESVLVETLFITKNSPYVIQALSGMIKDGLLKISSVMMDSADIIFSLMLKYHDVHTSLADICLLCMYNNSSSNTIITTDSDFLIYRDSKGKPLNLISPYKS